MPQYLLEGDAPAPNPEADALRERLRDCETALREERGAKAAITAGVKELRAVLTPLYTALRHVYGELDGMGISDTALPGVDPRAATIWKSWQEKMPGMAARFIELLLVHGEMNRDQLKIAAKCGSTTVTETVYKLNKAGLINKNGGKIALRKL